MNTTFSGPWPCSKYSRRTFDSCANATGDLLDNLATALDRRAAGRKLRRALALCDLDLGAQKGVCTGLVRSGPTSERRFARMTNRIPGRAAAIVLLAGAMAAPSLAQSRPDARIYFHGNSVAFVAGVSGGKGTLVYRGH